MPRHILHMLQQRGTKKCTLKKKSEMSWQRDNLLIYIWIVKEKNQCRQTRNENVTIEASTVSEVLVCVARTDTDCQLVSFYNINGH